MFCSAFVAPALAVGNTAAYPQDTNLVLSGPGITLNILSGSVSSSLSVTSMQFTVSLVSGTFTVRYPGPNPGDLANDGGLPSCQYSAGNNVVVITGPATVTFTPAAAPICAAPSGGSGGGGTTTQPFGTLSAPNGGQTLNAGSPYMILWSAGGSGVSGIKLSLSTDNGVTYPTVIVPNTGNSSYYYWTVPDISTTRARIKMELVGTTFSDVNDAAFTIIGSAPTVPPSQPSAPATTDSTPPATAPGETPTTPDAIAAAEAAAPAVGAGSAGTYVPTQAAEDTPTINVDKKLEPPPPDKPALCESGSLIKGSGPAVYFCGKDGKRYVFVNEKNFHSWFKDFSAVKTIADDVMAQIKIGGNINYKPGVRMVKIQTDPKVYAVARNGLLRWVQTEAIAMKLYGADWNRKIDDVSDAFFFSYKIGDPITNADIGS